MSHPAQYFTGILLQPQIEIQSVLVELEKAMGALMPVSAPFAFDLTNYYEPEMGPNLVRYFVAFKNNAPAHELASFKEATIKMEQTLFSKNGVRQVNLDPGYLDAVKLVLASTKAGGHKIALSSTLYADMVMDYFKGEFRYFEWSFPDFKSGSYSEYFKALRKKFLEQQSEK